jgi:hypothetical protein
MHGMPFLDYLARAFDQADRYVIYIVFLLHPSFSASE